MSCFVHNVDWFTGGEDQIDIDHFNLRGVCVPFLIDMASNPVPRALGRPSSMPSPHAHNNKSPTQHTRGAFHYAELCLLVSSLFPQPGSCFPSTIMKDPPMPQCTWRSSERGYTDVSYAEIFYQEA